MEFIVQYFETIPTSHRTLLLVGGLTLFFILENLLPLFNTKYNKWKHTGINLFFTLTTVLVNFSMAFILVMASDFVVTEKLGLFQWISFPVAMVAVLGVLTMDFIGAWLPHYIEHHIKWMWKFHLVHHTDQHVSTTTANRHHPGESVIRFAFTVFAILILGVPMWLIFLYQSCSLVATQFSHSNIKMPEWLDNALVWVLCTPNMHRVHHHYRQPYSDKNYGNIFSIWDRVFGTFVKVDNTKLKYGVDTHMEFNEANDIGTLLKIPFLKYKPSIEYPQEEKL